MIFITVGTDIYQFDRFLKMVDNALAELSLSEEVLFQTGNSSYVPTHGRSVKFLPYQEMKSCMQKAAVIITHGGVGTVDMALSMGKKPIVCPRQQSLNEVIDNHQLLYSRCVEKHGYVFLVQNEAELKQAIPLALDPQTSSVSIQVSQERDNLIKFLDSLVV